MTNPRHKPECRCPWCYYPTFEERFWSRVRKGAEDECWEWTGPRIPTQYGTIMVNGRVERAHRASWFLAHGPVPDGMWVLHSCDNRGCVNPIHLFLGTRQDNVDDMVRKGRGRYPGRALTHCKHGHEFTVENTYQEAYAHGHRRKCRACHRNRARVASQKNRGQSLARFAAAEIGMQR